MLARIALDQFCQFVHGEGRRFVHVVLEPDRLVRPQFGMRVVPLGEDCLGHGLLRAFPMSQIRRLRATGRCPVMRRPGRVALPVARSMPSVRTDAYGKLSTARYG